MTLGTSGRPARIPNQLVITPWSVPFVVEDTESCVMTYASPREPARGGEPRGIRDYPETIHPRTGQSLAASRFA